MLSIVMPSDMTSILRRQKANIHTAKKTFLSHPQYALIIKYVNIIIQNSKTVDTSQMNLNAGWFLG